jgi:hypothetical protein
VAVMKGSVAMGLKYKVFGLICHSNQLAQAHSLFSTDGPRFHVPLSLP